MKLPASTVTRHMTEPQARRSGDDWWTTVQNSVWHHFDGCDVPVPQGRGVVTADHVAAVFTFVPTDDPDRWSIEVDGERFAVDHSRTPLGKRQCHRCWDALRKVAS